MKISLLPYSCRCGLSGNGFPLQFKRSGGLFFLQPFEEQPDRSPPLIGRQVFERGNGRSEVRCRGRAVDACNRKIIRYAESVSQQHFRCTDRQIVADTDQCGTGSQFAGVEQFLSDFRSVGSPVGGAVDSIFRELESGLGHCCAHSAFALFAGESAPVDEEEVELPETMTDKVFGYRMTRGEVVGVDHRNSQPGGDSYADDRPIFGDDAFQAGGRQLQAVINDAVHFVGEQPVEDD